MEKKKKKLIVNCANELSQLFSFHTNEKKNLYLTVLMSSQLFSNL